MSLDHFLSLRPDQFRDRFGWVVGLAVLLVTVAMLLVEWRFSRPARLVHMSATALIGAVLGGLLLVPALPRLATALELVARRQPPAPTGPLPVADLAVVLPPPREGSDRWPPPITAQLWLPAAGAAQRSAATPTPCAAALAGLHLAGDRPRYPIVLYAPALDGTRDQNASTAAELASHGYVVLAIDDIAQDPMPPGATAEDKATRILAFDFSSAEAFETTLRRSDDKVRLQAEKALAALDRLQACARTLADPRWRARLDFGRVGFFGWSFGGATAAEAGVLDSRIAAVVNLDGWLFGTASMGALQKPYLLIYGDFPVPGPRELNSPDPTTRYEALLTAHDIREAHRLTARPGSYGFSLRNSYHENFSDAIYSPRFLKSWLVLDPRRASRIVDDYLLAFFGEQLSGTPAPLLHQDPPPYGEMEPLNTSPHWRLGTATAPTQSAAGSK